MKNCTVVSNRHSLGGAGGIYVSANLAVIVDSTICSNVAQGDGGGIIVQDNGGHLIMSNCTVFANEAGDKGGGMWIHGNNDYPVTMTDRLVKG